MPELLSGAGEFEGMRFVSQSNDSGAFQLLDGGVESPIFPRDIAQGQPAQDLRNKYEGLLQKMLEQQNLTLADIFGGDGIVEEFWASPDVEQRSRSKHGEWHIPLDQCTILSTYPSS